MALRLKTPKRQERWETVREQRLLSYLAKNGAAHICRDLLLMPEKARKLILKDFWEALLANRANNPAFAGNGWGQIKEL